MGLSLKPQDQEAGGFFDDQKVKIVSMRWVMWDYNGEIADDAPALKVVLQPEDEDEDEREQYYSAGSADKVKPSKDGLKLEPTEDSKAKGLNKNTKAAAFLKSIFDAGFDADQVEDEVDFADGTVVHVNQKPWKGYNAKEDATILLVTKIYDDEKPAKGGKSSGGGKSKSDPIKDKTNAAILALLEDADKGKIAKSKLSTLVFKHCKKDPDVKKITEMALDDDFLGADDAPFDFDGDTIVKKDE